VILTLLSSVCPKAVESSERLCEELRKGIVISSTESAYRALDTLSEASVTCPKYYNNYLIKWIPRIIESRPTSQVLINLLRKFLTRYVDILRNKGLDDAVGSVPSIISDIKNEVARINESIASLGSRRVEDGDVILTHSYSTTLIPLFKKALNRGIKFSVYVTESRPIGEGLVTAEILNKLGIRTTLIVDSAVRFIMKKVTKVFIGADAVAANGAVVSKIGTSAIALAAREARVRVYVAAGTYKFGFETAFGELIEGVILNDPKLIMPKNWIEKLAGKVIVREPLFDVTPPEYINVIITEVGLIAPQAIPILVKEIYGWPPKVKSIEELLKEVKRYGISS